MAYLSIEGLEEFFSSDSKWFSYVYYVDPKTGKIYLEYDIIMEAKYIHCYSLKEDKGVWLLIEDERNRTCEGNSPGHTDAKVAGMDKETSIEFMIQKILEEPKGHEEAKVDMNELEEKLRGVLIEFGDKI